MKKNIQEYLTYITPKFIFIPFDDMSKLRIKRNKIVFNNMFLGNFNNNDNIYSPVSGEIIGVKEINTLNGNYKSLVVENDFIDKREKIHHCKSRVSLLKYKKTNINEILQRFNLDKKYSNKKSLVIHSTYNKQTDLGDMVLNYENYENILETIDTLMDIYGIKNTYIYIPNNDLYSDFAYSRYINSFDNICIVNNIKKIPNDDVINLTVEEVIKIYYALFKEYFCTDTFITVVSENKSIIIKVKLFTCLVEIFKDFKIAYKDKNIYINDKQYNNIESFIITSEVKNIILK